MLISYYLRLILSNIHLPIFTKNFEGIIFGMSGFFYFSFILLLTALDFYGALRSRTYDRSILKVSLHLDLKYFYTIFLFDKAKL